MNLLIKELENLKKFNEYTSNIKNKKSVEITNYIYYNTHIVRCENLN